MIFFFPVHHCLPRIVIMPSEGIGLVIGTAMSNRIGFSSIRFLMMNFACSEPDLIPISSERKNAQQFLIGKVRIIAANAAGDSTPSAEARIVVP